MGDKYVWLQNYPDGVNHEVSSRKFENLLDLVNFSVEKYANQVAYRFMGKNLSFSELDNLSTYFGAYLQSQGLVPGEKIIIQLPNTPQYPIAVLGALKAGLVIVNTNPLYTPREMLHQYTDSKARAVVILENFASNLESIVSKTEIEEVIIARVGDMLGMVKGGVTNIVVKQVKKMIPKYDLPGAISFKKCMVIGKKLNLNAPSPKNDDTALIQYTGGTTGISKGAELSHGNIIANVEGIKEWFFPMSQNDIPRKVLGALPLYHIFALTVNVFSGLRLGFDNVLIINPRDQKSLLKELKKHKFFVFPGLNTLFNALLENPEFDKVDFSNLRITISGGMALQKHVADKWKSKTGCSIAEGYGLSETSPVLSCNPVDGNERIGTVGYPFPSTELRILRMDGSWAEVGEEGEICAFGPQVMKGYYNRYDETVASFVQAEDGRRFLKTGDIGKMQEDGYFEIVDRMKDMINVSGFNVYPNEVEEVIASCPGVSECACIGVPDEKTNEAVKAFVVKNDPNLGEDDIREYCKEYLTNYKRPKYIEFRESLPKTNVGKIMRRELKEEELV